MLGWIPEINAAILRNLLQLRALDGF